MEIDRYIDELVKLRQANGADLQVLTNGGYGPWKKAPLPRVAYTSKEYPKTFFVNGHDSDKSRGDKVVRI